MLHLTTAIVLFLFLIPKINIISLGRFNAGLRFDDLLLAAICAVLTVAAVSRPKSIRVYNIEKKYLYFVLIITIGTVLNQLFAGRGTLLFPLRFIEYFIFFYLGFRYAGLGGKLTGLMAAVFVVNLIFSLLQYAGQVGGFTVLGYNPNVSNRVMGITSGPWELGAILNLVSCYFLFNAKTNMARFAIYLICLTLILVNGSRMPLISQVAILVAYSFASGNAVTFTKRALIIAPISIVTLLFFGASEVASRSENLFHMENIQSLMQGYGDIDTSASIPIWSEVGTLSGENIDASWRIRGAKWIYAVKLFLSNPLHFISGVGAGVFGNALDGGWLRIIIENGIFGFAAFLSFIFSVKKLNNTVSLMCIAFGINMVMIDIYMSYKVMSLLLFCVGFYLKVNMAARFASRSDRLRNVNEGRMYHAAI